MLAGASEILGYATEALLLADDLDAAQKHLEEALHMADKLGERVYLPQLFLMEARIARARGERKGAAVGPIRPGVVTLETVHDISHLIVASALNAAGQPASVSRSPSSTRKQSRMAVAGSWIRRQSGC